jgi:hypothetical protein
VIMVVMMIMVMIFLFIFGIDNTLNPGKIPAILAYNPKITDACSSGGQQRTMLKLKS